jgi:hypothetical protein
MAASLPVYPKTEDLQERNQTGTARRRRAGEREAPESSAPDAARQACAARCWPARYPQGANAPRSPGNRYNDGHA